MCGIAGFQGVFFECLLDRMGSVLAHRGPDGDGCVLLGSTTSPVRVGLAHRRLAIIDRSEDGRQPMTVQCEQCGSRSLDQMALTYNGELYNHLCLRAELVSKGHVFHSRTDSEVLLHLYAELGMDMLPRLNGIFAFGITDGRERGRPPGVERGDLLLARDPFGVKPLYYAETQDGVLFGSEIKALAQCRSLDRQLDPVALHNHLAYLWTPAPATLLAGIKKLEPGCAMIVRGGAIHHHWRFYQIPYDGTRDTRSRGELVEELDALIDQAVRRQLIADVKVGAFLSGGLDSSAVVAMMRRAGNAYPAQCYCIGFESDPSVEGTPADRPYAKRVAAELNVPMLGIDVSPDIIEHLDEMLYHLDEPQADPAPLNVLVIARHARADGIPVLLSGVGGDDIFSGYRRHYALRLERFWSWLPQAARIVIGRTARVMANGRTPLSQHAHAVRRLVKAFSYADRSADERLSTYFWWSTDALRRALYAPALAEATGGVETAAPMLESLSRIPLERDPLNRMLFLEAEHFLADHNLNYTDKMGMAAGVEVRVPLLDLDLVGFAARLPTEMKQDGPVGKAIFKEAMNRHLPHAVVYRAKTGFGAPLRRWLHVELRDRLEDALSVRSLRERGWFNPRTVRALIDLDRSGRIDASYTIFALLCIELWSRQFIDRVPGPLS